MAPTNEEYWRERAEQLEQAVNERSKQATADIAAVFMAAIKELCTQQARWYALFMTNEEISLAEAKKRMTQKELAEFKWTLEDYIAAAKANGISGDFTKQLENASSRVHITRLEALKLNLKNVIENLYNQELTLVKDHLESIYQESYYHQAFDVQQGIGVGWGFAELDEKQIEKAISKPWAPDGSNFSERIWKNKEKLVKVVEQEVGKSLVLGSDPQKAIDAVSGKMEASKANAGRLVMTESAFVSGEARKDCFNELRVERYKIIATLDMKTSAICQDMDGEIFAMKDYEAGVTAPPFHPNCRTTTAPYYEDMDGLGERAARDPETGETYHVPADMTYPEWYDKYVKSKDSKTKSDSTKAKAASSEKKAASNSKAENKPIASAKQLEGVDALAREREFIGNAQKDDINRHKELRVTATKTKNVEHDIWQQKGLTNAKALAKKVDRAITEAKKSYPDSSIPTTVLVNSKTLAGKIGGYDPISGNIFLNVDTLNDIYSDYYVANNLSEAIIHEVGHQEHWNAVKSFYKHNKSKYNGLMEAKKALEDKAFAKMQRLPYEDLNACLSKYACDKLTANEPYAEWFLKYKRDGSCGDAELDSLMKEVFGL